MQAKTGAALIRLDALIARLGRTVTSASVSKLGETLLEVPGTDKELLAKFGITLHGGEDCVVALPGKAGPIGRVTITNHGTDNFVLLDCPGSASNIINVRFGGHSSSAFFPRLSPRGVNLQETSLRSSGQCLFWGAGATSVWSKIEMEGAGATVAVGDDCMLSAGVWIRNHDMHAVFDVMTGEILNREPTDVTVETHVWFGFESLLLGAERIGFGSILGARSLVRDCVPPKSLVLGMPGKVVRQNVSWDRSTTKVASGLRTHLLSLDRTDDTAC